MSFLESHFYVTLLTCLVTGVSVPFCTSQLIQIIIYAEEAIVGVCFRHDATHTVAVVIGDWALIMSIEGGVAPSTDDPEQAIFFHVIWSHIVTLEAVWEGGAFAFGANDLAWF